jgi:two-component sensor histidine kinase
MLSNGLAIGYAGSLVESKRASGPRCGQAHPAALLPATLSSLLVRELTHRINNEFASAISQLSLAATRTESAEAKIALSQGGDLLEGYVVVHRALQFPEREGPCDAAACLRRLCRAICRARLERRNVVLVLSECPLQLPSEQCWLLGVIVNELVTNAARHAFNGRDGEIRVELSANDRLAECRVSDNGSAAAAIVPGRGLSIVGALAAALGGTIAHRFGPQGSSSVLSIPLAAIDDRPDHFEPAHSANC